MSMNCYLVCEIGVKINSEYLKCLREDLENLNINDIKDEKQKVIFKDLKEIFEDSKDNILDEYDLFEMLREYDNDYDSYDGGYDVVFSYKINDKNIEAKERYNGHCYIVDEIDLNPFKKNYNNRQEIIATIYNRCYIYIPSEFNLKENLAIFYGVQCWY